jgi:hypothetical protein
MKWYSCFLFRSRRAIRSSPATRFARWRRVRCYPSRAYTFKNRFKPRRSLRPSRFSRFSTARHEARRRRAARAGVGARRRRGSGKAGRTMVRLLAATDTPAIRDGTKKAPISVLFLWRLAQIIH